MNPLARMVKRWRRMRTAAERVLSMNQRNLLYIYPHNRREHFPLADDKLKTKRLLAAVGVPVPATYHAYGSFFELRTLAEDLAEHESFVVKPAQGSGGGGILVITRREGDRWISAGGRPHSLDELRAHLSDIVFGIYSFGLSDQAILEQRILSHPQMAALSPLGLADIRLILFHGRAVMAMSRLPTRRSDGKANLHQGAVGVGIDLQTGRTVRAILGGESVDTHPDTGEPLVGREIPFWERVREVGEKVAAALPLGYIGADIALSPDGPLMLEINVRPGLQIQNANGRGMRRLLEGLGGMHTEWDEG